MSLDKAIEHGKEKRKPYKGSKAIDPTCRNHGSCDWCKENRLYQKIKMEESMKNKLLEYENDIIEDVMIRASRHANLNRKQLIKTHKDSGAIEVYNLGMQHMLSYLMSEVYNDISRSEEIN